MQSVLAQPTCSAESALALRPGTLPIRALLMQISFVGLFVAVLAWFRLVDVYYQYFFTATPLYLGYTIARVLFIAYLAWTQFYVGRKLLQFWNRRGAALKLILLDEFILCFYAGGALIAVFNFVLGFLSLYYFWPYALGSVGLVAGRQPKRGQRSAAGAPP